MVERFGYEECPPHPAWIPPVEWLGSEKASCFTLHLVTMQPASRLHSQMDPGAMSGADKIAGRERVRLNAADAAERGIRSGDVVRVYNERGACLAGADVSDDVRCGVAVIETGAWFDPADDGLERHGNPNVLTLDIGTSRLAQGPSALSVLVEVERCEGIVPDARPFDLPTILSES